MKAIIFVLCSIIIIGHASLESDMIAAHNRVRREVGLGSLEWSDSLAADARNWAEHLAATNIRKHSSMDGYGENFSRGWPPRDYSPEDLFALFYAEKKFFIPGKPVPHCSNTGTFSDVAHYTQIIWKDSKKVGCGYAQGDKAILVCQYYPRGNIAGQTTNS